MNKQQLRQLIRELIEDETGKEAGKQLTLFPTKRGTDTFPLDPMGIKSRGEETQLIKPLIAAINEKVKQQFGDKVKWELLPDGNPTKYDSTNPAEYGRGSVRFKLKIIPTEGPGVNHPIIIPNGFFQKYVPLKSQTLGFDELKTDYKLKSGFNKKQVAMFRDYFMSLPLKDFTNNSINTPPESFRELLDQYPYMKGLIPREQGGTTASMWGSKAGDMGPHFQFREIARIFADEYKAKSNLLDRFKLNRRKYE